MVSKSALRDGSENVHLGAWYASAAGRVWWHRLLDASIASADFKNLSAFRIVLALVLLGNWLLNLRPCFDDFYTDRGLSPADVLMSADAPFSASIVWLGRLFALDLLLPKLYPLALCFFLAGYGTRATNIVLLLFHIYLGRRMPYVAGGADDLIRLLLLWSLFLPLNRYWSIDASGETQSRDRFHPALPLVCMKLQILSLYFFSGLFKLATLEWLDGSAIQRIFRDNTFAGTLLDLSLATRAPMLLSLATWGVIALQISAPLLIYGPWRWNFLRHVGLLCLALLQGSFIFFLQIGMFPYLSITVLILVAPPGLWRTIAAQRARKPMVEVFYDSHCCFCRRIALLLAECAVAARTRVAPASLDPEAARAVAEQNSWLVRDAERSYVKWQAVAFLLRFNPVLAPLGIMSDAPPLRWAFASLYDWIGRHRRPLGKLVALLLPFRSERPLGRASLVFCGVLALAALYGNIATVEWARLGAVVATEPYISLKEAPPWIDYLQVRQRWSLFAPAPTQHLRGFVLEARTPEGEVDLNSLLPRPVFVSDGYRLHFRTQLWQKFFAYLTWPEALSAPEWAAFGHYWCREAQASSMRAVFAVRFKSFLREAGTLDGGFSDPAVSVEIPCQHQ